MRSSPGGGGGDEAVCLCLCLAALSMSTQSHDVLPEGGPWDVTGSLNVQMSWSKASSATDLLPSTPSELSWSRRLVGSLTRLRGGRQDPPPRLSAIHPQAAAHSHLVGARETASSPNGGEHISVCVNNTVVHLDKTGCEIFECFQQS